MGERHRFLRVIVLGALLAPPATSLAGCVAAPTTPSNFAPFRVIDLREGTGAVAAQANFLEVHYTGWLYNADKPDQKGAIFDTSLGGDPFAFFLGTSEVIEGWDEGLVGMKEGGVRRLIVPSSMAYGTLRSGKIPPFATLVFDIELVRVTVLQPDPQ
jgi:FKBP-type peptidyl-prolyl cis-trans isomerase FkpA